MSPVLSYSIVYEGTGGEGCRLLTLMGHALPDWLVVGLLQTLNRKDIKQMFCCDLKLLR